MIPLVGGVEKYGRRGHLYRSEGSLFMIRTADAEATCRCADRLHWTKLQDADLFDDRYRAARDSALPFDIVLATLFGDEVLVWIVPAAVARILFGFRALYIRALPAGGHVAEVEDGQRPLGDLDLRQYLFCWSLSEPELESVRRLRAS